MSVATSYLTLGPARSAIAAGAVLVSVGVVPVSPVAAPVLNPQLSTQAYTLTASSTLLNVPLNMLNMALSMPAWEVLAMNRLADAMFGTGSWQVWGPTNVIGFDEWDPPKLGALIDMMMPVQPFSSVLGDQVNMWAEANLPMNAGCAALPGACPDIKAQISGTMKVPLFELINGYQFPTVTNPFTLQQTSWSGQYVKLDPGAALTSLWSYLSSEPQAVQTAPIGDYFSVPFRLAKSVFDAFYPFVQNSEWFNPKTPFSGVFRALAPVICPSCGPEPYANPWLYGNYPPKPASTRAPAPAATADAVAAVASSVAALPSATAVVHDGPPTPPPAAQVTTPADDRVATPKPTAVDLTVGFRLPSDVLDAPIPPSVADAANTHVPDAGMIGHRGPSAGGQSSVGASRAHATRGISGHSDSA